MKNAGALIKNLSKMQAQMMAEQKKLAEQSFVGSTAGGAVKVAINGNGEMRNLSLHADVMSEGAETVSALVLAAYREAHEQKEKAAKAALSSVAGGLMPFGLKLPGAL